MIDKKVDWIHFKLFHQFHQNFLFKFDLLEVLGVGKLQKEFGGVISKIEDFFCWKTFGGHYSVF